MAPMETGLVHSKIYSRVLDGTRIMFMSFEAFCMHVSRQNFSAFVGFFQLTLSHMTSQSFLKLALKSFLIRIEKLCKLDRYVNSCDRK